MVEHGVDTEEIVGKTGFWLIVPFLLLFVGAMLYFAWLSGRGISAFALSALVSLPALLAALGLYDGKLFWWARRGIGFYVFLFCLWYAISQGYGGQAPKAARLETAVECLVVALSALRYALTGRLWVDVLHVWFSRLLAPLANVNIGRNGNNSKIGTKNGHKWYGTNQ